MKRLELPLILLVITVVTNVCNVELAKAGECVTTDKELYEGVVSSYEAAKKGAIAEYGGWGMHCWRGNQGLGTKLRTVLTDILFDSRIHPVHVASAIEDYKTVFGIPKALLAEVQKKQGRCRYDMIAAIRENKSLVFSPVSSKPDAFPGDLDFIDGPANIRKGPKGPVSGSLPDNAKVRTLLKQGNWVEIDSDGIRGWVSSANLMSSHVDKPDDNGFYVLSRAAYMGYYETVRFLMSRGARADLIDGFGRNALHWAVRGGFAGLPQSELEMVKLLAAVPGVNVN